MTEQEIYEKAKKRVKAKKGFIVHFGVFCATIALLFTINFLTISDSKIWWAFFPTLGWGIGIVAHYITVFGVGIFSQFIASFGYNAPMDDDWEEKELEKEIKKIRRQNYMNPEEENNFDIDEELDLKEIEKLRNEDGDKDFV